MRQSLLFIVVAGLVAACGDSHPRSPSGSPSIQSFAAGPGQPIPVGGSAKLTAVFSGGIGVVNPGAVPITSGQGIDASPSATTTYTLVVTASGGASVQASATVTVNAAGMTLGTDGGTLQAPDGAALVVPSGALDGDTALSFRSTSDAPPGGIGASSPVYVFEPAGLLFARPVRVTLPLPDGVTSGSVYWSRLDGNGFDPIGGTIDAAARTITVTTAHFSQAVIGQASPTRTVSGVGQLTYISATSRQSEPIDFALQGVEALVRDSGGKLQRIVGVPGTGAAAGTFTIPGVPVGEYILHSGPSYLVTDSNTPDLGGLRGGKPGRARVTSSTIAHFHVDGLEPWADGAMLEFYVSEGNSWDFATDRYASPQVGDTSMTFDFDLADCDGTGFPCAEVGPGDHAVLAQVSPKQSSTGLEYYALTRLIEFPPFSLVSGASVDLSGTTRDVSQDHSIAVDFRGSQWGDVVRGAHPSAVSICPGGSCFVGVLGQPGLAEDGFYSPNSDPLYVLVDGESDLQSGTMRYGSPAGVASGSWGLLFDVRVAAGFFPAPLPGSIGLGGALRARGFWNGIEWTTTTATGQAGPIVPPVSMVGSPSVDGQDLFADRSGVGLTPALTWNPPSTGTVSFYRVDVYALSVNGSNRTISTRVASVVTRATSLTLPSGILTEGVPVVISIAAVAFTSDRTESLLADAPFKLGIDRAEAALTSGVLVP
jgi:hypothetical protein